MIDLWVAAWRAAMPAIDFEARRTWIAETLDDLEATGTRILVAECDGTPAGFLTVDPASGLIDQLAVDPARQGRGVAAALLAEAKVLCPAGLDLIVNRDNAKALRLYRRHGFVAVSEGRNPRSGLPTITMRWQPC